MESRKRPSNIPEALQTWAPMNRQTSNGSQTSKLSRYQENHWCSCGATFKTWGGLYRHQKADPGRAEYPRNAIAPTRPARAPGHSKCELRGNKAP